MNKSRPGDYIVIKHALKDMNGLVGGVKFRGGYAVVERNSKVYQQIKKLPMIKGQPEYPLLHLKELSFITRTADIKLIFGIDVYNKYKALIEAQLASKTQEETVKKEEEHIEVHNRCSFRQPSNNELCSYTALENSPSGYCKKHILEDPKLNEVIDFKIPSRLTKDETKKYKEKVLKKLG